MSNAPSKPVSFFRPKVGYFSNRPRIYDCSSFVTFCFQVHQSVNSGKSRTADSGEKHRPGNIPSLTLHNFRSTRHGKNHDRRGSDLAGRVYAQYVGTSTVHTLEFRGILYLMNVE